ncbi:hypothetical protein EFP66_07670 [Lacticaseibacillus paracasei]|jgi:hypothetical protein|nr:hypothetical protein [Lacticaseibacillus paracasei]
MIACDKRVPLVFIGTINRQPVKALKADHYSSIAFQTHAMTSSISQPTFDGKRTIVRYIYNDFGFPYD